jgi:hypothetical protein
MLRLFCVALTLIFGISASVAQPVTLLMPKGEGPVILVNDSNDVISETQGSSGQSQRVRPQRYICVIDQSSSISGGGQVSCPAKPGRVGGRCRCANVTGSGTLFTY